MTSLADALASNLQGTDDNVNGSNSATAPGANANIFQITAPPAGLYRVKCQVRITTGANASLADNIRIQVGSTTKRVLVHPAVGATTTLMLPEITDEFRCDGIGNIRLNCISAEAASVVYSGSISARRIAP